MACFKFVDHSSVLTIKALSFQVWPRLFVHFISAYKLALDLSGRAYLQCFDFVEVTRSLIFSHILGYR